MSILRLNAKSFLNRLPHVQIQLQICRYWVRTEPWIHKAQGQRADIEHFLVFVEQGQMAFEVGGQRYVVGAGECIWMQPGQARAVLGRVGDEVLRHINLRIEIKDGAQSIACSRKCMHIRAAQSLHRYFLDFLSFFETPGILPDQKRLALTLSLMGDALRLDKSTRVTKREALNAHQRQLLLRFITEHIAEGISPADLAISLDLSLDYFTRCFRQVYGIPPRQYLLEQRMRQAAVHLIETNDAIHHAAKLVGIADSNYFCRQFKKVMGLTPGAYRKRGKLPEGMV